MKEKTSKLVGKILVLEARKELIGFGWGSTFMPIEEQRMKIVEILPFGFLCDNGGKETVITNSNLARIPHHFLDDQE